MMSNTRAVIGQKNKVKYMLFGGILLFSGLTEPSMAEQSSTHEDSSLKQHFASIFSPQSDQNFNRVRISELSQFQLDTQNIQEMPRVVPASSVSETAASPRSSVQQPLSFNDTIRTAVQRHPEISQAISTLAAQNASIDDIAYQTANAMINIKRYQEITRIAEEQIQGIARIAEITNSVTGRFQSGW